MGVKLLLSSGSNSHLRAAELGFTGDVVDLVLCVSTCLIPSMRRLSRDSNVQ